MNNYPYKLIFVFSNGEQEEVGEYLSLKQALQAKESCKSDIGKPDILSRVLVHISVIKSDLQG